MLLMIDNYDSFTYNLYHYLAAETKTSIEVIRNDKISVAELKKLKPSAIVLSPGPCTPSDAGICLEVIEQCASSIPILGVCLGHQAIGQAFGGKVVKTKPMHGKTSEIFHTGHNIFKGIPSPFIATRYHSLIVERASLPSCLEVTATTADKTIMGLKHKKYPVFGVQFHPESIASEHGHAIIRNFLSAAKLSNVSSH